MEKLIIAGMDRKVNSMAVWFDVIHAASLDDAKGIANGAWKPATVELKIMTPQQSVVSSRSLGGEWRDNELLTLWR